MPGRRHARPRGTRTSFMVRWDAECKIRPTVSAAWVSNRGEPPRMRRWSTDRPELLLISLREGPDLMLPVSGLVGVFQRIPRTFAAPLNRGSTE